MTTSFRSDGLLYSPKNQTASFHSNKPIELPSHSKKKPSASVSQFDLACAKRLREGIKEQGFKWSSSKWAEEFRLLRQQATEEQITATLEWWFANNETKAGLMPAIKSAAGFRRHFQWLTDLATKHAPLAEVTISLAAHDLVATLRRERWPMGSDKQLATVIQLSLDAHSAILKRTYQLWQDRKAQDAAKPKPKKADRHLLFLEELWRAFFQRSENFVEAWMKMIHKSVANWDAWNGDLRSHVFHFDHQKFQRMGQRFTSNYCGREEEWNQFCQEFRTE